LIEDSIAYLGQRPVEWLLDKVDLTDRFHLVHATHLTSNETIGIAKTKANVVICPTTEGNLGDGLFPLNEFQENNGKWSIGTDSHIGINPLEELRLLDYGQRLITHKRNTYTSASTGNSGEFSINMATLAGRKAMNNFEGSYFKVGESFNASILDATSPLLAMTSNNNLASSIVYTSDATNQLGTIVNGQFTARENDKQQVIKENFVQTIKELKNR